MGLMNVGQTERPQIIQLFGRGVRLKGYGSSLKRSGKAQLRDGIEHPKHIGVLETLSIFGIRADYRPSSAISSKRKGCWSITILLSSWRKPPQDFQPCDPLAHARRQPSRRVFPEFRGAS
ncbi:MAG: hypothetical protein H7X92_06920 [Chitinophagales bacterium]|nr:hypothetical protein [Hyphomicrobiales bacterium]